MDDSLKNVLIDLLAPAGIEETINSLVNSCALAVAGKPADVRAGAVAWLRNEATEGLSKLDEFRGKNLAPIADYIAGCLAKRIGEIEASGAGRG